MKVTIEIPDDLHLEADAVAKRRGRKFEDLLVDGLRLVVEASPNSKRPKFRMTTAPVTIGDGNPIPALSNLQIAELLEDAL